MTFMGKKKGKEVFIKKAIESVIKPNPKLNFGIKNKRYFSSSMDSSDGLSTTLNEMSNQSKNKFIINKIPSSKDLEDHAKSYKLNLHNMVFNGGEEYEFVFTVSPKYKKIIEKLKTKENWKKIKEVKARFLLKAFQRKKKKKFVAKWILKKILKKKRK